MTIFTRFYCNRVLESIPTNPFYMPSKILTIRIVSSSKTSESLIFWVQFLQIHFTLKLIHVVDWTHKMKVEP